MKNRIQLLTSVAALYMFAAVAPASAVTMKAIYTGIVSSGTEFNIADQSGMFGLGTGARVFNNQAFTLTFAFNPSLFGVVHDDTPTSNVARGGPFDVPGSHSPIYNAELLINGVTKKIFSNAAGFVGNYNPLSGYNNAFHSTFSQYINANFYVTENSVDGGIGDIGLLIPLGLEMSYHVVMDTLLSLSNGHFDFNVFDDNLSDYSVHNFGTFSATELTVSTVLLSGALPLFAAGLIGLGAVSRKRVKRKPSKH